MRCKNCHYALEGLAEHRCPECGRAFDPDDALSTAPAHDLMPRSVLAAATVLSLCVPFVLVFLFCQLIGFGWDGLFIAALAAIVTCPLAFCICLGLCADQWVARHGKR
jgi:hypothetical protein